MNKLNFIWLFVLLPFITKAQNVYTFSKPVVTGSTLLHVNQKLILIEPIDVKTGVQKWTTFDSTLTVTSQKKLVNPGAAYLVNQAYLYGDNFVWRVDQMLIEGEWHISAYIFDMEGNLLHAKAVEAAPTVPEWFPSPFMLTQSPDKKSLALVQPQVKISDSLSISIVVINDTLEVVTNTGFNVYYDAALTDFVMPLISNKQQLFFSLTDKFDSYKINAGVTIYRLQKGEATPQAIPLVFERKKIKNLQFAMAGDSLFLNTLYAESKNKKVTKGLLHAYIDVNTKKIGFAHYNAFDQAALQKLRKTFAMEGRKGNLSNYIATLPQNTASSSHTYAVLMPETESWRKQNHMAVPPPIAGIGAIRQQLNYTNSFIGTQPPGYARPMNIAEASAYAAVQQLGKTAPGYNPEDTYKKPKPFKASAREQKTFRQNLLFFSFQNQVLKHQYIRLRPIFDASYDFFTYVPHANGYSALHYIWPTAKKAYLNLTTIDKEGLVSEKKIYEDKTKVLLDHFPFIATENLLYAFYQDKLSGKMGLLKIAH